MNTLGFSAKRFGVCAITAALALPLLAGCKPVETVTQTVDKVKETVLPVAGQEMYRLYNANTGEHFYTADAAERDDLVALGWEDEGVGWTAPATSDVPVFRLYNPNSGDHHYTTDAAERDNLVLGGWVDEGIGWYSDPNGAVPLYREYNPNQFACNHNYTTDASEHEQLVSMGWVDEGVGWYGVK